MTSRQLRRRRQSVSPGVRVLFVALALGAWAACIIACRPAWSPDGKQVLFSYRLPGAKGIGFALHDRESGKTRRVFTMLQDRTADDAPAQVRWLSDGKRFVAVSSDTEGKDDCLVSLVDATTGNSLRTHRVKAKTGKKEVVVGLVFPPVIADDRFVFFGGKSIVRLDLETGETKVSDISPKSDEYVFGESGVIYYFIERGPGKQKSGVIGTLDPKTLEASQFADLASTGYTEVKSFLGVSKDGEQFGLLGVNDKGSALLVYEGGKLQTKLRLDLDLEKVVLANLQWSKDGGTVLSTCVMRNESAAVYGLLEIPLDGTETRFREILLVDSGRKDAVDRLPYFQLDVSPDGSTAAVSTALFPVKMLRPEDRALFLVDLTSPAREITKVPAPSTASSLRDDRKER